MTPRNEQPKNPILTKEYWDRPPSRKQGDPHFAALYQAVGMALSNWEMADQEMATLFSVLVGCSEPLASTAIRRAYGSIESNTGRRKALMAAAEVYFRGHWPLVRKSINQIQEAISFASKLRDDVAHGIVLNITINARGYGSFLMPPEYNTGRTHAFRKDQDDPLGFKQAQYRYVAEDILDISFRFQKLKTTIRDYMLNCCIQKDGKIPIVEYLLQFEPKDGKKK